MKRLWQALLILPVLACIASAGHDRPGQEERKERHRLGAALNGKDIEGWKTFDPKQLTESWYVKEAFSTPRANKPVNLFSPRDDYENFHYRIEVKISDKGNSGQYFRTKFGGAIPRAMRRRSTATFPIRKRPAACTTSPRSPRCSCRRNVVHAGSDREREPHPDPRQRQEGRRLQDEKNTHTRGHFAIQQHGPAKGGPDVVVALKKIEVKELPATK